MKVEKKKKVVVKPKIAINAEADVPNGYHELTQLPSKLKLYNDGAKIFARPLKMLEIKQLTSLNEDNYSFIIDNVLKSTTILHNLEFDDILTADKLYIIFWERANTYQGDGFSVKFNCESCMDKAIEDSERTGVELSRKELSDIASSKYDFNVSNLQLQDIRDDYDPNFELELKTSGHTMTLYQHTIGIEKRMSEVILNKELPNADIDFLTLASVISSINGEQVDIAKAYSYLINDCAPADYIVIEKYKKDYDINIDPVLKVNCKKCGGEVEAPLSFHSDFFLPST